MISSKKRMLNVLKGQLMYINEDPLSTEEEKNEFINIINILIDELNKNNEQELIPIEERFLYQELEKRIEETQSSKLKRIYNVLKGQLMISTDNILQYEELTANIYLINYLKIILDNMETKPRVLKKQL